MTDITERPTPEVDGAEVYLDRVSIPITGKWVGSPFARSLEQRLGAVTEALQLLSKVPPSEHVAEYVRCIARVTLVAIKEA